MNRQPHRTYFMPLNGKQAQKAAGAVLIGIILFVFLLGIFGIFRSSNNMRRNTAIQIPDLTNPAVKNNIDLVKYAENALRCKWGYVYGTYGQVLSQPLLDSHKKIYSDEVTPYLSFIYKNWMGRRVTDCSGLIKGYGWFDPATGAINYNTNGMPDLSADGMYQAATEKGGMDSMPDTPGLAVWMDGHIGVYVGRGEVIESMTTTKGVVKTRLQGRGWLAWLKIPSIRYLE